MTEPSFKISQPVSHVSTVIGTHFLDTDGAVDSRKDVTQITSITTAVVLPETARCGVITTFTSGAIGVDDTVTFAVTQTLHANAVVFLQVLTKNGADTDGHVYAFPASILTTGYSVKLTNSGSAATADGVLAIAYLII